MFSGAVKIQNQSDFIAPSQACVVALNGTRIDKEKNDADEAGIVEIQRQAPLKAAPGGQPVKVTLSDCLACSGCITSAEAVLLEHQSVAECRARLADRSLHVVVTLSPQSRASLAAHLRVSVAEAHGRVVSLFTALGAEVVIDASVCREIALLEAGAEFVSRFRAAGVGGAGGAGPAALPVIASACPGWVCYAEKSVGDAAVPLLGASMSPQAVAGVVAKLFWATKKGYSPRTVYHVALMPCFDKKLEASRDQLRVPGEASGSADGSADMVTDRAADTVPGTDLVLTTGEILELALECGADLRTMPAAPLDPSVTAIDPATGTLWGSAGGGSGGYAEAVAAAAAAHIHGQAPPGSGSGGGGGAQPILAWQSRGPGGSADFQEAVLRGPEGTPELRFATVYGFRNIQTLMRQVKRGACHYHYVEVMACPSACNNGGGQIKAADGQAPKALLAEVQTLYGASSVPDLPPGTHPLVREVYGWLGGGGPGSDAARAALHTTFQTVQKTAVAQLANW